MIEYDPTGEQAVEKPPDRDPETVDRKAEHLGGRRTSREHMTRDVRRSRAGYGPATAGVVTAPRAGT